MAITFAAIADDDTGATDLAGMLAEQDVRTILAIDLPSPTRLREMAEGCDAIVIAVASRAIDAADAYQRTRAAAQLLRELHPRTIQIKYCSTFDSTAVGIWKAIWTRRSSPQSAIDYGNMENRFFWANADWIFFRRTAPRSVWHREQTQAFATPSGLV